MNGRLPTARTWWLVLCLAACAEPKPVPGDGAGGSGGAGGRGGRGGTAGGGAGGTAGNSGAGGSGTAGATGGSGGASGGKGGSAADASSSGGMGGGGGLDATSEAPAPDSSPPAPPVPDAAAADGGPEAPAACPQLVAGWTRYQPTKTVQRQGGDSFCEYRESDGVEFFKMTKNPAGVIQRCEARVNNDYTSGANQFEGDVRVTMGDGTCVHQVFKFFMLDAFPQQGGQLRHYSADTVVSGVFGKWVHINTVHDSAAGKVDLYIDCVKRGSWADGDAAGPRGWYHKYGLYGIRGEPPLGQVSQVEWRDVRYYRR